MHAASGAFPILAKQPITNSFPPLGPNLKVLLVWPKFPPSFWGFEGVLEMLPEAAMTPPLGLVTVAALCPPTWSLRLLDHAFDEIRDGDIAACDLVMVSAMHAQRHDAVAVLRQARRLGVRTFIGGPWASSDPAATQLEADHVMVGEAEEVFADIARELEQGTAQALYRVTDKPDMSHSPIPRFDLLRREMYTSMPVQFSRGCPFQCEFCDAAEGAWSNGIDGSPAGIGCSQCADIRSGRNDSRFAGKPALHGTAA